MSRDTIKARFVGGSKHNELIECARLPVIRVPKPVPVSMWVDEPVVASPYIETENYFLCRFYTGFDPQHPCVFSQYVHESLMRNGEPARESYSEDELAPIPDRMFEHFMWRLLMAVRS